MAIKKSEIYRSLWASCDALRGGMDASQYKDYVLSLLFIKYISDKYAGEPYAPITVPDGASFVDMVALKGKPDIGDQINKKIVAPLAASNQQLSQADFPDFNDSVKLGDGKEKVDRLTNLIAVFESPSLDFKGNRADGDDILGDAYEYLMRHFATESGKSKGQFYTPAEVSRVMAQMLGIKDAATSSRTTVYDPTCGSGSLLLKVGDQAGTSVTLYGQEKDAATSGLARMNMILHDYPTAEIRQGNSLADPRFLDGEALKTFDYVVANPPFSDKRWTTGLDPENDPYDRFKAYGVPPAKQGDYAYLLHIVRSLKSAGKGACILPHGVLFRGNAEAEIRRKLVRKGYIKAIIGLPANLFYGTGIPACIVVMDKEDAQARKGIFMIDASQGFMKDGPKNRLRSQDIHRIVDTFWKGNDIPGYARMVPFEEIEKNEFNLNLPRYIDSQKEEDRQDIEGHLRGGIPAADIDALQPYWDVYPTMKQVLLRECRPGYFELKIDKSDVRPTIFEHPEFVAFREKMRAHYDQWRERTASYLKGLDAGCDPKQVIFDISEDLLAHYTGKPLVDKYDIYQHLMDYWSETMQDDCYLLAADGWKAETYRIIEEGKNGKQKDKGWACDLVPKEYVVARFFAGEQAQIDQLTAELETVEAEKTELEEEQGGEDGAFADLEKVNKGNVNVRLKEIKGDADAAEEEAALKAWLKLTNTESDLKKRIKETESALDKAAYAKFPELTVEEIKALTVDDKWLSAVQAMIEDEMDRISHALAERVLVLAERYEFRLPEITERVANLETKVNQHLERMGFAW
ncbi:type I restriction enzyme M protein [Roseovarius sp. MBR-78]|jgi:type I restriction enzyme M protein|uniref:type I restriction-modification system subunit M n=1 Tax=Roseovarius sp. MBR-78 TaxID=3156460 RepID=UPI003393BD46